MTVKSDVLHGRKSRNFRTSTSLLSTSSPSSSYHHRHYHYRQHHRYQYHHRHHNHNYYHHCHTGSLSVIGSPIGFARKVGSGVKSFFYEPYQGLPCEFKFINL